MWGAYYVTVPLFMFIFVLCSPDFLDVCDPSYFFCGQNYLHPLWDEVSFSPGYTRRLDDELWRSYLEFVDSYDPPRGATLPECNR